jgi:DNA phosphorothioation-dependent restriction protein DptG
MNIFEIIKLYGQFGDVRKAVTDAKGEDAVTWFYSRKFIGAVLVFGSAVLLYLTGVTIDVNMLNKLTDNVSNLIGAIVGIYGFIMFLVSALKGLKKPA